MASIRLGAVVAEVRGSIGGNTYSRNANGAYARNRVKGTNPRTEAQTAQRARLTAQAGGWRDLTDAQRRSFNDGVEGFPYTNRLGERSLYTGPQLFTKLNLTLVSIGQPSLVACPIPVSAPAVGAGILTVGAGAPDLEVTFDAAAGAGWTAQVFASAPVSPGRRAASTRKPLLGSFSAATATIAFVTEYEAAYGPLVAGNGIVVEVVMVNNATGQSFVAFTGAATVGA